MGLEIERKFLVAPGGTRWPEAVRPVRAWALRQGYVTPPGADPEVRVRELRPVDADVAARGARAGSTDGAATHRLTVKAAVDDPGAGTVTRVEVETDLDAAAFEELWALTGGRRVEKTRVEVELDDARGVMAVATVDRFGGALTGLVLAEVEFADAAAARAFAPPPFLRTEVSHDRRYRNAALAVLDGPPQEDVPATTDGGFAGPDAGQGRSMAYRIAADETLGDGLRHSARDQLDGAIRALEERIVEEPATAIHDARKRIKKTRALIRLAKPALGRKVARRENDALRAAAATLSAARDADVLVQTVDALAERYVGRLPAATFEIVRHELSGADGPRPVPAVDEALRGLREVRARVDGWPLHRADRDAVLAGEGRAYAAGRAQLPSSGDAPDAHELHEWRKRVKDLWYHGLLLRNAWVPVVATQAEEAHRLSEILGDDHDLFVLHERLCDAPLHDPAPDVDGLLELIERRRAELLREAVDLGRRVYAETPKAHRRRLRRLVDAWQEPVAA